VRITQRRKITIRQRVPRPGSGGHQSALEHVPHERQAGGRRAYRSLTVIDQFTGECVWLGADRQMTGMKIPQALEQVKAERGGLPDSFKVDNLTEFSSRALEAWAIGINVQLGFIRRGRPVGNGFIESFNDRLRDEC